MTNTSVTGTLTQSLIDANNYAYTLTGNTTFGYSNATQSVYNFMIKAGTYSFSLNSSSNYFGVSISRQGKYVYWVVYINTGSNKKYLGQSKDEENAARIYDKYVIENNLPHPLNFPKGV